MTVEGSHVASTDAYRFDLTGEGVSGFLPTGSVQTVKTTADGGTETKVPDVELYFSSSRTTPWRRSIPYADLKDKHKLTLDLGLFVLENTAKKPLQTGIHQITISILSLNKSFVVSDKD